jgi:hypothetical protein
MDITPFIIGYKVNNNIQQAEIRPCCREDNVVDYAVRISGKLTFTITRDVINDRWVVALKNADEIIDDDEVQRIGNAIQQKYSNSIHESR